MKRRLLLFWALFLFSLLALSCGEDERKPLKIGALLPLS